MIPVLLTLFITIQEPEIDWKAAKRAIVRLEPSAFTQLPNAIAHELRRRRCTIPQVWDAKKPHNVARGHFTSSTSNDWAVLCSVKGTSSILVFRGAAGGVVARLDRSNDSGYLQGTLPGQAGYSRDVAAIDRKQIAGYCKLWNAHARRSRMTASRTASSTKHRGSSTTATESG